MNDALKALYQETIMDHGRRPRNFHVLEAADFHKEGYNPVCGDRLTLFLKLDAVQNIQEVSFEGTGCAISMASASLLTETLKGQPISKAKEIFQQFHQMLMEPREDAPLPSPLKETKLRVLKGVKQFPSRVKCATLAWHTLEHLLKAADNQTDSTESEPVSTE